VSPDQPPEERSEQGTCDAGGDTGGTASTGGDTGGTADTGGDAAPGAAGDRPAHDDTGLDLARTLARSMAGAARMAPRKKRRPPPQRSGKPTTRTSGAHPDDRDPQPLDATVGRLVADQGWSLDLRVHGVFSRWPEIVGAEVAQHCQPTSFADGKLVVRTDSTAWATQLRLLAPTVVRRLNEELGHGSVTVIDVEGPNLPSWKKGRLSARDGRGPRDTYG
jgi:predicted nucleic acid-binding Zn ribbon protein